MYINGTDPLVWSAFRESSFGVAKLVLLNDTTASYTWTRYACDSGPGVGANPAAGIPQGYPAEVGTPENNWRQNFSSSCITLHDNSAQAMELVDETVITNTWQTCQATAHRRLSAISEVKTFEKATKVEKIFHKAELKREVEFRETDVKGEQYVRPSGSLPRIEINPKKFSLEDSCGASGQIHLTIGNNPHHSVILSFASAIGPANGMAISSHVLEVAYGTSPTNLDMIAVSSHPQSYSTLPAITGNALFPRMGEPVLNFEDLRPYVDTTSWAIDKVTGEHWPVYKNFSELTPQSYTSIGSGTYLAYNNPGSYYNSAFFYNVEINHLTPGVTYYYQLPGDCNIYSFKIPEHKFPMTIGVFGDLGVTQASQLTVNALVAMNPDVIINTGDLSYADGWAPVWDTFGELMQQVAANVPVLTTGGNHEYVSGMEGWLPYFVRWPQPHKHSHSTNPCYFGVEVGKANIISLCSFADYEPNSIQYNWAVQYFNSINRKQTPWVIMTTHMPWYTTSIYSLYQNELMRRSIEPLIYEAGVDIVVYGHTHVYERTYPMYNFQPDPCGAIHVTLGDGGNYEGNSSPFTTEFPNWDAFREGSFGAAKIELQSTKKATFTWTRNSCQASNDPPSAANNYNVNTSAANCISVNDNSAQAMEVSDSFEIVRPNPKTCPNRWGIKKTQPARRALQGMDADLAAEEPQARMSVTSALIYGIGLVACGSILLIVKLMMRSKTEALVVSI